MQQKKEALPDLKTAAKEASIRYQEANKAREQKKKVDDLKRELAWAHVAGKEQELKAKVQENEKVKRVLPKLEASLAEAKVKFFIRISNVIANEFRSLRMKQHLPRPKGLKKRSML